MKKIALVIASFFLLTSFTADSKIEKFNFIGKWSGTDSTGKKGMLTFTEDGYASMTMGSETIGGKEFTLDGRKGSMRYKFNEETNPIELDLILIDLESGMQQSMPFAVRIIDKNSIEVALSEDGSRPKDFEGNNSMKLERQ